MISRIAGVTIALSAQLAFGQPAFMQPEAGIMLLPAKRQAGTVVVTYGVVPGADEPDPACSSGLQERRDVVSQGWLRLTLVHPAGERARVDAWLAGAAPLSAGPHTTKHLLQILWRAQAIALRELAGGREPGRVTYELHLAPSGCQLIRQAHATGEQARRALTFPLAFSLENVLAPELQEQVFYRLLALSAHETVHLLQLMPYDRRRLAWLRGAAPTTIHGSSMPVSMDAELAALHVDRCIRQAILPNDWNADFLPRAWREQRALFEASTPDSAYRRLYDRFFSQQAAILGSRFVGGWTDSDLRAVFPFCAMWLRRGHVAPNSLPDAADERRARNALDTVRSTTPVLRWARRPYEDAPLPEAAVEALLKEISPTPARGD